jgi:lipoate-protein ligase A
MADWLMAGPPTVAEQLALDEALLEEAHEGLFARPVVRCWMAAKPTVVVGSSSHVDQEVDREACAVAGVDILRRPSGGLTVLLGPGCLMWSVIIPCPAGPPPVEQIHRGLLDPLALAINLRLPAGQRVERLGTCDLTLVTGTNQRKIGGNALRIRRCGLLYHGTLLHGLDLALVGHVLRHPPREPDYRGRRPHAAFLTQLPLGRAVLEEAVRDAFGATGHRDQWPIERVGRLVGERYSSTSWTERL